MGYGGALFWTGLARNLKTQDPERKVIFIHRPTRMSLLRKQPYSDAVIFDNNPDIDLLVDYAWWKGWYKRRYKGQKVVVVDIHDTRYHYWTDENSERINYREGKHAIQYACDVHGISKADLRPKIVLTCSEIARAREVLNSNNLIGKPFFCIEPSSKVSFTPNKAWFWDRWQEVVVRLSPDILLIQVGSPSGKALEGCVDVRGKLTFRETGYVLQSALGLVSCLGGLVHLNKAVGGRSVVLASGFEPLELATYPDDINLHYEMDCRCWGLKRPCPLGREAMRRISVDQVHDACKRLISEVSG